jgi:ParB/RepB/Spo0J family partition protein
MNATQTKRPSLAKATARKGKVTAMEAAVEAGYRTDPTPEFDLTKPPQLVPIQQLKRHPLNRHPTPAEVAKVKVSLQEDGLLEPLLVRRTDAGWYQIVSGETRFLAAKDLHWRDIACRVIECDDARALELLAICNAKRNDLDPIQKAHLIENLCKDREAGGAGMTQAQAAAVFGFKNHSGASNLCRLLELPAAWQERVAKGLMPESCARLLLPYLSLAPVMAAASKMWDESLAEDGEEFTREAWQRQLNFTLDDECCRLDRERWDRETGGSHPCRLDLSDDKIAKAIGLQRITLMVNGKATEVPVATNVKAYEKLQIEACLAFTKAKTKKQTAKLDKAGSTKKEVSPEERKRREKERDEQVERRVRNWRHRWILSMVAEDLGNDGLSWRLVAWLFMHGDHFGSTWKKLLAEAAGHKSKTELYNSEKNWQILCGDADADELRISGAAYVIGWLEAVLNDPDNDPRHPKIPYEVSEDLAARIGIDLHEEWQLLQSRGKSPRFESFWDLFPAPWLEALAIELKVNIDAAKTTTAKAECFRATEKALLLPKCLELKTKRATKAKGKK